MGYVVFMSQLAFQPVDDRGMAKGDPEIVKRGQPVPKYAQPFLINALVNSGMIVDAGDRNSEIRPVEEEPTSVPNPEVPPGPSGPALVDLGVGAGAGDTVNPVASRPKETESKAKWEAYAVSVGIDQAAAESMSKQELQTEVARREAATS